MTAMQNSLSRFRAVLGAGWILLAVAAIVYARIKSIPGWTALPVAAAFLIEFPFYILTGFDAPREWLAKFDKMRIAGLLLLTGLLPWLVYSVPTGEFKLSALALLAVIVACISFWYAVLPAGAVTDAGFLLIPAAAMLAKVFGFVYASPIPKVDLGVLGQLMLIRTAALAILLVRPKTGGTPLDVEFRFLPRRNEWLIGAGFFLGELPFVGAAYWALGLVEWRPHPYPLWAALGTFIGILWVVALSEEFFFRGLLQQWLGRWTGNTLLALAIASTLFGSAHLGFNHKFPNWRFAIVAGIAGVSYGMAWRKARSIQASMVTHALTVTLWRTFFL